MPFYYFFPDGGMEGVVERNELASKCDLYASGRIHFPKYDRKTNKFIVEYLTCRGDKAKWNQKSFETNSLAMEFYQNKYYEFMYDFSIMFYDIFKEKQR